MRKLYSPCAFAVFAVSFAVLLVLVQGNASAACFCLIYGINCPATIAELTAGVCDSGTQRSLQSVECASLAGTAGDPRCPAVIGPLPTPSPSAVPVIVTTPVVTLGNPGNPAAACLCLLYGLSCPIGFSSLTSGACFAATPRTQQPAACMFLAAQSNDVRCGGGSQPSPIPPSSAPAPSSSPAPSTPPAPSPTPLPSSVPVAPSPPPSTPVNGNPSAACLCILYGSNCPAYLADLTNGLCLVQTPTNIQPLACMSLAAQSGDGRCSGMAPIIPNPSPSVSVSPTPSVSPAPSSSPLPQVTPGSASACRPQGDAASACLCQFGLVTCTGICAVPTSWSCRYLASFTGSASCPVPTDAPPAGVSYERRRKEVGDLTSFERQNIVAAMRELQQTPSRDPVDAANGLTIWDSFTRIHAVTAQQTHNTLAFLPWHREFIYRLETEMRNFYPSVTLPWWDWTLDWAQPYRSPVFYSSLFGAGGNGPIGSGVFANLVANYPDTHYVLRYMQSGVGGRTNPGNIQHADPASMQVVINNGSLTFEAFANTLESFHASPHQSAGGSIEPNNPLFNNFGEVHGDLIFTNVSPNDPIFYLLHAGVDKFFRDRQAAFPNRAFEYDVTGSRALSDPLPLLTGATVADGFESSCVEYEPASRAAQMTSRMAVQDIETSSRQSSVVSAIISPKESSQDSAVILEEVLYVPTSEAEIDVGAAGRAKAIAQYAYLNKLDPILVFQGFRLAEEARIIAKQRQRNVLTNRDTRNQNRITMDKVAVNTSAVAEIMQEVERIEEQRTIDYYRTTARKPYRGIKPTGGSDSVLIDQNSPIWTVRGRRSKN